MKKILAVVMMLAFCFNAYGNERERVLRKAESGDLSALKQAFTLSGKSDGAGGEEISMSVGKSIKVNPRNFLKALKEKRSHVRRLDAALGNLGADFVDDFKRQKIELEARLKAIQSVTDKKLKAVREECEDQLKKQIESSESSIIYNVPKKKCSSAELQVRDSVIEYADKDCNE